MSAVFNDGLSLIGVPALPAIDVPEITGVRRDRPGVWFQIRRGSEPKRGA